MDSTNVIYGNCSVLAPDGKLMFRCDQRRIDWYLRNKLARKISDDPAVVIRLTFEPGGVGHRYDDYHLQTRENICCVCGIEESLSRHHVVPYCYRKHLRLVIPQYMHEYHDILPLCKKCHDKYERYFSVPLKAELSKKYQAPIDGNLISSWQNMGRHFKYAVALRKHGDEIPDWRRLEMETVISEVLGRKPTQQDIIDLAEESDKRRFGRLPGYKTHGQMVVEQIDDFEEFVITWRTNFIDNMKPKFLPTNWNPDRPLPAKP